MILCLSIKEDYKLGDMFIMILGSAGEKVIENIFMKFGIVELVIVFCDSWTFILHNWCKNIHSEFLENKPVLHQIELNSDI